ncbi:metalloregulator ArsR/SmtB family transcription factor [Bacillus sp. FJAT-50079]|uniref:helix-turn-helix transcriptional regulator n=1 Tax=Bacillus sp. FJAT-50079 TaxID=2833577 RepID=UPI001BCA4916|nr:metalloregulator ArsR/SmtB family transcription factor [Bacillus sp. FJAT-50079]MBS4210008.1 transcriptional regulator [Bacillus sp. FJAT-50079]
MNSRVTTREKILDLLKKEAQMTVGQLALNLNITEMAVRKHLNILDRDAFIHVSEVKQPMGRPVQVFSLTEKAEELFPKNYENLTVEFLRDLEELQGEEMIDKLFDMRSRRLVLEYDGLLKNKSNQEKIETLKQIQSEKGYMADLIKINDQQFELIEYNCPILEVSKNYKQACKCETNMFKEVLKTDAVSRTICRADGENHCRFLISFDDRSDRSS